jgi:alpha-soluble NSF attachment protein
VRAAQSLNRYCNIDVSFSTTREFKLLQELLGACEEQDVEAFTNSIVEYDRLSKLGNN